MSGARCRARPPCGRSVACAPAARTVLTRSLCSGTRPAGAWSGREQLRDCGYLGVVPLLSRAPSTRGGFRTSTSCRTASAASADTVGPDSFREPTGPAVPAERAGSRRHRAGVRSATGRGRGLRPRPRVAKTVGAARRLRPSAGASFDHMVVVGFIRTVQASAPARHAVQRLRQGEVGPDRTAVDRCADGLCCHSSSRSPRRAGSPHRPAVRRDYVLGHLLDQEPTMLHFSSHVVDTSLRVLPSAAATHPRSPRTGPHGNTQPPLKRCRSAAQ